MEIDTCPGSSPTMDQKPLQNASLIWRPIGSTQARPTLSPAVLRPLWEQCRNSSAPCGRRRYRRWVHQRAV